jgi:thioredoxin 1
MGKASAVTAADFEAEVMQSELPVLVDFWASWCGPCLRIAPEIEAIAVQMEGRIRVRKVDVDADPLLANQFGIRSIPTMLVFKEGKLVDQLVGALPRASILARIERHLDAAPV